MSKKISSRVMTIDLLAHGFGFTFILHSPRNCKAKIDIKWPEVYSIPRHLTKEGKIVLPGGIILNTKFRRFHR